MISLVLSVFLSVTVAPDCTGPDRVSLGVGGQKIITVKPGATARSSRSDVLEVSLVNPTTVLLKGISVGFAEAIVESKGRVRAYTVKVKLLQPGSRLVELAEFFPCDSTLELKLHDSHVELIGEAGSLDEWRAAHEAVKKWPSVVVTGTLRESVIDLLFAEAQKALLPFPGVKWVRSKDSVSLEGERTATMQSVIALWEPKLKLAVSRPRSR